MRRPLILMMRRHRSPMPIANAKADDPVGVHLLVTLPADYAGQLTHL